MNWSDMRVAVHIVREKVSEDFYEHYKEEIQSYFMNKEDEIEDYQVFAYCLGLGLRDKVEMDFEPPFCDFCQYVFDGWGIPI